MASFRFNGEYSNGRRSLEQWGVTFHDYEPAEVPAEFVAKFKAHPEFEEVAKRGPKAAPSTPEQTDDVAN